MAYTALYRKYRPSDFDGVIGQDHIVRTLKNQITSGRVSHAYLFCGTRGTGKTSTAKIFAKAINCTDNKDGEPCGKCRLCTDIAEGRSMNVIEIDAASNSGVDNVREIREEVMYPPTEGHYKVYIIDEVHMLSTEAFNALLKTLEEPPEHIIFILATTDPQKVPVTILSRCQRFDFKRITVSDAVNTLKKYLKYENASAEDKALSYICMLSDGSMRDALSLLDQCMAFYYGEEITLDKVLKISGNVDNSVFFNITDAIIKKNTAAALDIVNSVISDGRDIAQFVNGLIAHLRNLLIAVSAGREASLADMSDENFEKYRAAAAALSPEELIFIIRDMSALLGEIKYAGNERVLLEVELIKLTTGAYGTTPEALLARISGIERDIKSGKIAVSASAVSATADEKPKPKQKTMAKKKASSDEVKKAVGMWKEITKGFDAPLRAIIGGVKAAGGENDEMVLICDNSTVLRLLKERLEAVSAAYGERLDREISFKLITKEDYGDDNTSAEDDKEFESLAGMYFPEADIE